MARVGSKEIYDIWKRLSADHRYLRPKRWNEIEKIVLDNKVETVLEFGAGISSLLFSDLGLKVTSFETDEKYLDFVRNLCANEVDFRLWDNETPPELGVYDLALVDGCLPRRLQLRLALKHAGIVAIDDFAGAMAKRMTPMIRGLKRLDSQTTIMAIFEAKR